VDKLLEFLLLKVHQAQEVVLLEIHQVDVNQAVVQVAPTAVAVVEEALLLLILVKHSDHQKFLRCT
jgi:hypothetical protein